MVSGPSPLIAGNASINAPIRFSQSFSGSRKEIVYAANASVG